MDNPMSTPASTVYAIQVTVEPSENGPMLVPDQEYNFEVLWEDELHMVRPLFAGDETTLLLTLSPAYGTTIRGVSFGRRSDRARVNDVTNDTGGFYYQDSPFKVSPGPNGSVQVTVIHDAAENRYRTERWFFDIWPQGGSSADRIDPQIYNKTPGGGSDGGSGSDRDTPRQA
jgi:hypothetical protein